MNLSKWKRQFPFAFAFEDRCPECGSWMKKDYLRDPATQEHWRGIEALVCTANDCDYAERL